MFYLKALRKMKIESETCKNTSFNNIKKYSAVLLRFYIAAYNKHMIYYSEYLQVNRVLSPMAG